MSTAFDPRIRWSVIAIEPETHCYSLSMTLSGPISGPLILALPVWTPGSYLVREFAKHVENVSATADQISVPCVKQDKSHWRIDIPDGTLEVRVSYQVYAFELTVRSSYLDQQQGFFNGANVFLYPVGWKDTSGTLHIEVPEGWEVATALEPTDSSSGKNFRVPDYDTLVDSPVQLGHFERHSFEVLGVPHDLVICGEGRVDSRRLVADLTRIIERAAEIFGGLPYSRYLFILQLTDSVRGGLEHRNSTVIALPRHFFYKPEDYDKVLRIFTHEFFHLWNVKRLRPSNLGPFDYQQEIYTPLLWALEGITDYYANLLLSRAGVVPLDRVLDHWAESFKILDRTPGRLAQTLEEASRDTWIKFYRPDTNTPNSSVSYYLKGALVGLMLDLEIRSKTASRQSLDTVMRLLWDRYGDRGYPEPAFEEVLIEVGGTGIAPVLDQYVRNTVPFDESVLATVGLRLVRTFKNDDVKPVNLGFQITEKNQRPVVDVVFRGQPAESAGLAPGDEIVAIDGLRAIPKFWDVMLSQYQPGSTIRVTAFRRDVLYTTTISADAPQTDAWSFQSSDPANDEAKREFQRWTGNPFPF